MHPHSRLQILRPLLGVLNLDLNLFVDLDQHFARWLSTIAVLLLHPTILFYLIRIHGAALLYRYGEHTAYKDPCTRWYIKFSSAPDGELGI